MPCFKNVEFNELIIPKSQCVSSISVKMAEDSNHGKTSTATATSKPTTDVKKKDKSKKSKSKKSGASANGSAAQSQLQLPVEPPKGFLPFSHDVITPELKKYAAEKLNETEETKAKALKEFHELVDSKSIINTFIPVNW